MVTTDVAAVLSDPGTDGVVICSSQPDHYENVRLAIEANMPALVEKPLVTRLDHFRCVLQRMDDRDLLLTVGLNRRYSPIVRQLQEALESEVDSVGLHDHPPRPPRGSLVARPRRPGRFAISEGEHFFDLCNVLVGQAPVSVYAQCPRAGSRGPTGAVQLRSHDPLRRGAVANITFDESGAAEYPQERLTVLAKGQVATLDDFARLDGARPTGSQVRGWPWRGHGAQGTAGCVRVGAPRRTERVARGRTRRSLL